MQEEAIVTIQSFNKLVWLILQISFHKYSKHKLAVDRISSAVLQGVSHEGRLIGGGAHNQEPDGDTRRRDSDLDRFGSSDRCNTLRSVSVLYCIGYEMYVDRCPLGDPCLSLYTLEG